MFLHGPTILHLRLHDLRRGLLAEAGRAGISFTTAIGVFFAAYYGLQHAEYRNGMPRQKHAVLAAPAQTQMR
jgi:hypothetical protein